MAYIITEQKIQSLIEEELSKTEVKQMIDDKIDSLLKKREFEKRIREIVGEVLINLFRYMYNQQGFFKSGI